MAVLPEAPTNNTRPSAMSTAGPISLVESTSVSPPGSPASTFQTLVVVVPLVGLVKLLKKRNTFETALHSTVSTEPSGSSTQDSSPHCERGGGAGVTPGGVGGLTKSVQGFAGRAIAGLKVAN